MIPRRDTIMENPFRDKGTEGIGVATDGVAIISNVSSEMITQGAIGSVVVTKKGRGYITPTLLVNNIAVTDTVFTFGVEKEITSITTTSNQSFTGSMVDKTEITTGKGAAITLTYDIYGKVLTATVTDGGNYYFDTPTLRVEDSSERGKGCLLRCTNDSTTGVITSVEIISGGMDYNPATTSVFVQTIGSGCEAEAFVQFYNYNKPEEVYNDADLLFDPNNGFLYKDSEGVNSQYAYVQFPRLLKRDPTDPVALTAEPETHSPILGWAYDGNPIYGPYVWKNGKNASGGVFEAFSGYVLPPDRDNIIPGGEPVGSTRVGSNPPSVATYPMGTFVQDYEFNPTAAGTTRNLAANNEKGDPVPPYPSQGDLILTDNDSTPPNPDGYQDYNIEVFTGIIGTDFTVCDEFNGLVQNTPEFPEELYPDGIFFYVATKNGEKGTLPYFVGKNFKSRPISRNLKHSDSVNPTPLLTSSYTPSVSYEKTEIDFDYNYINRFRNPYLNPTKDRLDIEIETIEDGSVSSCQVINGLPSNSERGDFVYFEKGSTGGDGAVGRVDLVEGTPVIQGVGQNVATTVISHHQEIDLDYFQFGGGPTGTLMFKQDFVFVPTSEIQTTSGSIAIVQSYDYDTRKLVVETVTRRLIQPGDVFFDNAHELVVVRDEDLISFMGSVEVTGEPPANPLVGQFWINIETGIASTNWTGISGETVEAGTPVYFNGTEWAIKVSVGLYDTDEDQSGFAKIVQTQKGFFALQNGGALLTEAVGYLLELENNKVILPQRIIGGQNLTISAQEPSVDTANQGDLWWSVNNGRLFIFYKYARIDSNNNIVPMEQWVCTQPYGTRTLVGASDFPEVHTDGASGPSASYDFGQGSIFISATSPTSRPDGEPLMLGDLWWSSESGILYIFNTNRVFNRENVEMLQSEWVATDPSAMAPLSNQNAPGPNDDNSTVTSYAGNVTIDPVEPAVSLSQEHPFTYTYSPSVTAIVSPNAPTTKPDGGVLEQGMLWWSPTTGRMYIYYTDADGDSQWTVTNPIGSVSTEFGEESIVDGSIDIGGNRFLRTLPIPPEARRIWTESLRGFKVGDTVKFECTAPGLSGSSDTAVIDQIIDETGMVVTRDPNPVPIPDGSPVFVISRFDFNVTCAGPTNLQEGDLIKFIPYDLIPNLDTSDLRRFHRITAVGTGQEPIGTAVIGTDASVPSEYGEVLGIKFTSLGSGYSKGFYIYFYGGGGMDGLGYAEVDPVTGAIALTPSNDARFPDGNITMINPGRGYTTPPRIVYGTELKQNSFRVQTTQNIPLLSGFGYSTSKEGIQGKVAEVEMISKGIGYTDMPVALGTYKKPIDQAKVDIFMDGTTIEKVELLERPQGPGLGPAADLSETSIRKVYYGGARYVAPTAVFYDLTGKGSGASATVTVVDGQITAVTMVDGGTGYVQPRVIFVEEQGKYLGLTEDIGKIKSMKVVNPGRNISPDRTVKPELLIDTKVIVSYQINSAGAFTVGENVYQGIMTDKLFTARVKAYDSVRQIVTLTFQPVAGTTTTYGGVIKPNENLIGESSGAIANVLREGQADTPCIVDGISSPMGFFVDDESMLSRDYARIQDSYYYQYFSYVISSPIQKKDYETIVRDTTHPVGFALFSSVIINSNQRSGSYPIAPSIKILT